VFPKFLTGAVAASAARVSGHQLHGPMFAKHKAVACSITTSSVLKL
jgi:hypothetical protein